MSRALDAMGSRIMSHAGLAAVVQAAAHAAPSGSGAVLGAVVRLFGSTVGVVYEPDEVEVARRATEQPEAIIRLDLLDCLMTLPVGMRVAIADLTDAQRTLLWRTPRGAVERHGESVVRRALAPVSVQWAVVAARNWRTGLQVAGRLAPYCARSVLLPAVPTDWEHAEMRAAFFGVGVIVRTGATVRTLVEPDPYVRRRHTPAQWLFAEEVWRQIRASASPAWQSA